MRLVVGAQEEECQSGIFDAFKNDMSKADKHVLSCEMALSGVKGKPFSLSPGEDEVGGESHGPAFLIYYAPQFMRQAGRSKEYAGALSALAEVYRQSRSLWPLCKEHAGVTVTIRIEQMKDRAPSHIRAGHRWGDGWFVVKKNEIEAIVEQRPIYMINSTLEADDTNVRLLCLWDRHPDDEEEEEAIFEELELIKVLQDASANPDKSFKS